MDGHALRDQTIGESGIVAHSGAAQVARTSGGPPAPLSETPAALKGLRMAGAAGASMALHLCVLIGFIHYMHPGLRGAEPEAEAPIELVLESDGAKPESTAGAAAPSAVLEPPATDSPADRAPAPIAETPQPEPMQEAIAQPPAPAPIAALPVPKAAPDADAALQRRLRAREAERAARERERRRAVELAREQADEKSEQRAAAHAKRQTAAQRAAQQEQADERTKAREARRRADARAAAAREAKAALEISREGRGTAARGAAPSVARAPARSASAADAASFDAASYRAIVARAVRAAVGSRCSIGAGSRVVIALTISRSGAISGASISHPSGNSAFDAASITAVRNSGPFPPPTGTIKRQRAGGRRLPIAPRTSEASCAHCAA